MKRRNKSRLTKTDVNTICEMQKKIDAYESYIIGIGGLVQQRDVENYKLVIPLCDTPIDDIVNSTWKGIQDMKRKLSELNL